MGGPESTGALRYGRPAMSRPRESLWRATLIVAGVLGGSAAVEIGLRLVGEAPPFHLRILDPRRGEALRPGAQGWYEEEGRAFVSINRHGFRDRDHDLAKAPPTFRVAVLGDSFTEALQVDREATFAARLETELRSCPQLEGRAVEALNFGVSGYGTAQALLTLRHHAARFAPDVVLLAFFTGNDVVNNSRELQRRSAPAGSRALLRPFFVYRDGRLVLDDAFLESDLYSRPMDRSPWSRLQYALLQRSVLLQQLRLARIRLLHPAPANAPEAGLDESVYREAPGPAWEAGWRVTEGVIGLMHAESAEAGARLLVVTLSNPIQVHPDPTARHDLARRLGVEDLLEPERRVSAIGERLDIPTLHLAPPMQRRAEEEGVYFHGFPPRGLGQGHWNEEGHRFAAERMTPWICERGAGPIRDPS